MGATLPLGMWQVGLQSVLTFWILLCNLISLCFQVWDIPKKRIRNIFRGHSFYIESVDFSPDGRHVVFGSWDGTVHMWNMRDGSARILNFSDRYTDSFWSVRFSPSGQLVVAGDSGGDLRIWSVRTGQPVRRWTGHEGTVGSVAFMAEGKILVSGGDDGVVKCWDVGSLRSGGEPVATKILKHGVRLLSSFLFPSQTSRSSMLGQSLCCGCFSRFSMDCLQFTQLEKFGYLGRPQHHTTMHIDWTHEVSCFG